MTAPHSGTPPAREHRLRTPLVGLSALMLVPALFAVAHASAATTTSDAAIPSAVPAPPAGFGTVCT